MDYENLKTETNLEAEPTINFLNTQNLSVGRQFSHVRPLN